VRTARIQQECRAARKKRRLGSSCCCRRFGAV
jgi:hypothetical protein